MAVGGIAQSNCRAEDFSDEQLDFFEKKIRPVLANNCYTCHSTTTNSQGGLRIDDRQGLLDGGGSGPALVPGDVSSTLLIKVIEHADGVASMPPKKKLTESEIEDIKKWVADGAAWPKPKPPEELGEVPESYDELLANHWAWQPLREPSVPSPRDQEWPRDDIDRFIQVKIEDQGLVRSGQASRQEWIRRIYWDLIGLPPSVEQVQAFFDDRSPDAKEKVVDELLDSRFFAEKWGRHWLDIARYGESTGSSRNLPYPHAWRYRDYVINSFATDKPFDRFIVEQLAGDLLPAADEKEREELLTATGYLAIGVKDVNQRYKVRFVMDNVDEQIDAVTRGFLGITASCARCHDHKFDPVPMREYYALAGIFTSTDTCAGLRNKMGGGGLAYYDTDMLITLGELPDPSGQRQAEIDAAQAAFKTAQKAFQSLRNDPAGDEKLPDGRPRRAAARQEMNRAQQALLELTDPAKTAKVILGVRESKNVADTELRYRGEAEQRGPAIPRGFLSLAAFNGQPSVAPEQSGRLQLAQWIAHKDNPLTARVLVNRVWQTLFGRGIVSSVDNFGVNGDRPTHPELLDHLAVRFQRGGWSIKSLIRNIVLSNSYQLSSESVPSNLSKDPGNLYVWRHSPRRLTAEEIRDAMLLVSNELQASPGVGSAAQDMKVIELPNNGPVAREIKKKARESLHRSVYLPLLRGVTPNSLEAFDAAEQGTVTGTRSTTTVPSQALYLLNDAFVRNRALAFARSLLSDANLTDDGTRVQHAFQAILGRPATPEEVQRSIGFIEELTQVHELIDEATKTTKTIAVDTSSDKTNATRTSESSSDDQPAPPSKRDDEQDRQQSAINSDGKTLSREGDGSSSLRIEFALHWKFAPARAKEPSALKEIQEDKKEVAGQGPSVEKSVATGTENATTKANAEKAINAEEKAKPKPPAPINPDQIVQEEPRLSEETVRGANAREAAWMSFVQSLYGTAEFRFVP